MKTTQDFDRSVCFTFFNSYLEQAKQVQEIYGSQTAYEYFVALSEYGLYQKDADNPIIKMLISGLKNTIDANQKKRSHAFSKGDKEQTDRVLQYYSENPEATQREIATAVDCSLGKVNSFSIHS